MLKKELRLQYIALRENIPAEFLINASLGIANRLLELSIWSGRFYHLFLPIADKKEIDTSFILSILQGKDKNVVLPKVFPLNLLRHYLLTDDTRLEKNKWGIPEPVDGIEIATDTIDIVFVPLLAFDLQGNRVGYGKGFYDRFLGQCRKDTLKIGLSLFGPETRDIPVDEHDVRLDYCVTPDKIYRFSEPLDSP